MLQRPTSATENLPTAGSPEAPDCRCGAPMHLSGVKPDQDAEVKIFTCAACQHEFQLMAWRSFEPNDGAPVREGLL